jgi:hypothetical protein
MFQKVWHELNFAPIRIDYTYGQLYVYIQVSPIEIQTATEEPDELQCDHRFACTIASRILPPSSSPAFIHAKKNWAHI